MKSRAMQILLLASTVVMILSNTALAVSEQPSSIIISMKTAAKPTAKPKTLPKPQNIEEKETKEQGGEKTDSVDDVDVDKVLELLNKERAKKNISPLKFDLNAQKCAQIRAKEIIEKFSHTRPNGKAWSSVLYENGYENVYMSENIAAGQKKPDDVVEKWMNSEVHRKNILNSNMRFIGIGHVKSTTAKYSDYWVLLFWG